MASARSAWFVYYRVDTQAQDAWLPAVDAMQAALRRRWPGLVARLMCRMDDALAGAPATWMEVYEHPDGMSSALQADLLAEINRLPLHLTGPRHTERFSDRGAAAPDSPAA